MIGRVALAFAALLTSCSMATAELPFLSGQASVVDGDTIEIHGQRIRLHGIDAAESGQICTAIDGRQWRCGAAAANALAEMISRRPVSCWQKDVDRYDRIVATCEVAGQSINAWMVESGWAAAYLRYSTEYEDAEGRAKEAGRGVWAGEFEEPWKWRRRGRD